MHTYPEIYKYTGEGKTSLLKIKKIIIKYLKPNRYEEGNPFLIFIKNPMKNNSKNLLYAK